MIWKASQCTKHYVNCETESEQKKLSLGARRLLSELYHTTGEIKTKPAQNALCELLRNGLQADVLICRTNLQNNMSSLENTYNTQMRIVRCWKHCTKRLGICKNTHVSL